MRPLVRQARRFAAVGLLNTAIGLLSIYALMLAGARPAAANAAGYLLGMLIGFVANRAWTFASTSPARAVLPRYAGVLALAYAANLGLVVTVSGPLAWNPYLAQLVGVGVYAVLSFAGCRWFVFRSERA